MKNDQPIQVHLVGLLPGVKVPMAPHFADAAYKVLIGMQRALNAFMDDPNVVGDNAGTNIADLAGKLSVDLQEVHHIATENMARFVNGAVIAAYPANSKNANPFDVVDHYIDSEMPR